MQTSSSAGTIRYARAISLGAIVLFGACAASSLHAQALGTGGGNKSVGRVYFGGRDDSGPSTGQKVRVLRGRVLDKNDAPVKGALVYLKESKTSTIKTVQADEDGVYRFVQLSNNLDYELWAQVEAKKSDPKAISSFDNRQEVILNLHFSEPAKTEAVAKPAAAKP